VTVAEVRAATVPVELSAIGRVVTATTVAVKARVGGELVEVSFKEGQEVRRGDLLFRIDPRPYAAALAESEARLARDQALLDKARSDVERYAKLVEKDFVTREQFDQATATAASLAATVEADRAAVESARLDLEYCTITAPIGGRVGSLLVHRGNLVKANADSAMVVINQVHPIDVSFSVPEQYLGQIRARSAAADLPVTARIRQDGVTPATGTLSFIDNAVDTATGTIDLKATFANQDSILWPGQFVDVVLTLDHQADAVVIPAQALVRSQEGTFAYVVADDNTVASRSVRVDRLIGRDAVISEGLSVGDRVVTDGQVRLTPGATVEVKPSLERS